MKESRYSAIVFFRDFPVSVVVAAKDENDAKQMIEKKLGVGTRGCLAHVEAVWRHDPEDDSKGDDMILPQPNLVS